MSNSIIIKYSNYEKENIMQIDLTFDQILNLVNQLSLQDKEKLKHEIDKALTINSKKNKTERKFGLLKEEKIWISDDFDEPLEDFKDYM